MSKFKTGDKVIAKKNVPYGITRNGWIGTVERVVGNEMFVTGEPLCSSIVVAQKHFRLVKPKIVITTDGKTTTAKLFEGKKVIKTAQAKCSPEDKFDFNIGAAIAIERLTGQAEDFDWKKFKAGKLQVKINNEKWLEFLKQCEEHDLNWTDNIAIEFNPWDSYKNLDGFSKLLADMFSSVPKKFVWLCTVNGKLFWTANPDKEIDEYEFV